MIKKYRKKSIIVEAIQLTSASFHQCCEFINGSEGGAVVDALPSQCIVIWNNHRNKDIGAHAGVWFVKQNGFCYCYEPEEFKRHYEEVRHS